MTATCDGYEWRGDVPWKCQLPAGHKAPDGFLGRSCRGRSCSHGPDCDLPWPMHDWSYEADFRGWQKPPADVPVPPTAP